MRAEGGQGARQTPLRTPQHGHATAPSRPGLRCKGVFLSYDQNHSWKHSGKSPLVQQAPGSPRALPGPRTGTPSWAGEGSQPPTQALWGDGDPPGSSGSERPRVGRSFSRPASAEVFAAIGTGAAELVAWQHERVLFPMTNIISIDPDHLPFQMSAQAGKPSKGKQGSSK